MTKGFTGVLIPNIYLFAPDELERWIYTLDEPLLLAILWCTPPRICSRCCETQWRFIAFSFEKMSATYCCDYCKKREIVCRSDKECVRIPNFFEFSEEEVKKWILKLEGDLKFAVLNCTPPINCRRCKENQWLFVSLSPNKKSATYYCDYCNRKQIVVAVDADDETTLMLGPEEAQSADHKKADLDTETLKPREKILLDLLNCDESRSVDDLIVQSGLLAHEVLTDMLSLELKRFCRQLPGKRFVKTKEFG